MPWRNVSRWNEGGVRSAVFSPRRKPATADPPRGVPPQGQTPPGRASRDGRPQRLRAGARGCRQGLEVEGDVARRLEALLRASFSRQCRTIRSRAGRNVLVRLRTSSGGSSFRIAVHRLDGRVPAERSPARQHLVEDGAEREDVGAVVRRPSLDLLGRHVAHRAEHRARLRPLDLLGRGVGRAAASG